MLPEKRVVRAESIDGGRKVVLHLAQASRGAAEPQSTASRAVPAILLLDASGLLVGVDVDPDGARVVLMLGAHEEVKSTEAASAILDGDTVTVVTVRALRLR